MCSKWPRRTVNRSRGKLGSVAENVWWCSPGMLYFFTVYRFTLKMKKNMCGVFSLIVVFNRICLHSSLVILGICTGCGLPIGIPTRTTVALMAPSDFGL